MIVICWLSSACVIVPQTPESHDEAWITHLSSSFNQQRRAHYAPDPPPPEWARCNLLFGRSTTAREVWLQKPPLLAIVNHFLRTVSMPYNDGSSTTIETDAILSAASTLDVRPGVKAQGLHRDDFIWQWRHNVKEKGAQMDAFTEDKDGETGIGFGGQDGGAQHEDGAESGESGVRRRQYRMGQDACIGLLVPGVDTCVANGATLVRLPPSFSFDSITS